MNNLKYTNNISVDILGDTYSIAGDVDPDEIKQYANFLDKKLVELSEEYNPRKRYDLAILCGLNIVEEMFRKKKEQEKLEKFVQRISKLLDSLDEE